MATDASGNKVDDLRYTAYGETRLGGSYLHGLGVDRAYTGQTWDELSNFYWYGSRAYDPTLARFLSVDTIVPDCKNPQSLNRYSYTLNNPLKYKDPSGHRWEPWFDGGGGGGSDEPPPEPGDNPPDNPPEPPPAVAESAGVGPAPDPYGSLPLVDAALETIPDRTALRQPTGQQGVLAATILGQAIGEVDTSKINLKRIEADLQVWDSPINQVIATSIGVTADNVGNAIPVPIVKGLSIVVGRGAFTTAAAQNISTGDWAGVSLDLLSWAGGWVPALGSYLNAASFWYDACNAYQYYLK